MMPSDQTQPPASSLPPAAIWRVPALLGAFTVFGLVAALVGDGLWDAASWLGLALPLLVVVGRLRRVLAGPDRRGRSDGRGARYN